MGVFSARCRIASRAGESPRAAAAAGARALVGAAARPARTRPQPRFARLVPPGAASAPESRAAAATSSATRAPAPPRAERQPRNRAPGSASRSPSRPSDSRPASAPAHSRQPPRSAPRRQRRAREQRGWLGSGPLQVELARGDAWAQQIALSPPRLPHLFRRRPAAAGARRIANGCTRLADAPL